MPRRVAVSCQLFACCCLAAFPAVGASAPNGPEPPSAAVDRPGEESAAALTAVFDRTGKVADHWTTADVPVVTRAKMELAVRTAIPVTGPSITKWSDPDEAPPRAAITVRASKHLEVSAAPAPAVAEVAPLSPTLPLVVGGGVAAVVFLLSLWVQYGRRG